MRRGLLALVGVSLAAGCGGTSATPPAHTRTIALNWREGSGLTVEIRSLVIGPDGWRVSATLQNGTRSTFVIGRPHHVNETEFGVLALTSADSAAIESAGPGVYATRFVPPLPRALHPNDAWSGTFSGRGRLSHARFVRIELGRFFTYGPTLPGAPRRFRFVSDHVARLG
jgi:hypothetical protein